MSILELTYQLKNEISIKLDYTNKSNVNWNFLDNLELKENNKFFIEDEENNFFHQLNLYKKRNNLHIFSCCSTQMFDYFGHDFYFYLIWINNTNVYCIVQDNLKQNKIKENNNNIFMESEDFDVLLEGLFLNKPTYYLDSNSRCKSIKNLEKLPKEPYKIIIKDENKEQPKEINGIKVIPHQIVEFVPI